MFRTSIALGAIATLLCASGCQLPGGGSTQASYSTNVDKSIDAVGVRTVTLRSGSGSLELIGEIGIDGNTWVAVR